MRQMSIICDLEIEDISINLVDGQSAHCSLGWTPQHGSLTLLFNSKQDAIDYFAQCLDKARITK
jgi:hypothetical protein